MKSRPLSLRRVLSRGLITIQVAVLVGFTLVAAVPFLLALAAQKGLDEGVVDDIVRSVARIEDRSFYLKPNGALQEVVDTYPDFWFILIDAGCDIEFVGPNQPVRVKGDASALSRAIGNLVHNAMSHGGPKVDIRVEVNTDGRVCVSDNGHGVEPEHREEIFWPFHRLSQSPNGA